MRSADRRIVRLLGRDYRLNDCQHEAYRWLLSQSLAGRRVPTHEFQRPGYGGSQGDRRVRALREMGMPVRSEHHGREGLWWLPVGPFGESKPRQLTLPWEEKQVSTSVCSASD